MNIKIARSIGLLGLILCILNVLGFFGLTAAAIWVTIDGDRFSDPKDFLTTSLACLLCSFIAAVIGLGFDYAADEMEKRKL